MGVKNISIRDRVYKLLKQAKKNNESFSDVIEEVLTGSRLDLKEFYGVLRDSQVLQEIEIHTKQMRETTRFRVWLFWTLVFWVISYHEILSGVKQKKAKKEERFFRNFFSKIPILPYTQLTAEHSSSLSATLSSIGCKINALDVLIAAIAIENGAEKILSRDQDFLEIAKIGDIQSIIYT